MSIMDMFANFGKSSEPTASQGTPVVSVEGNIPANAGTKLETKSTDGTGPNGVIPAVQSSEMKSPLDEFSTLWETDPNKKEPESMFAGIDAKKMMETAGKVDFTKVITQDQMAKITAGGEGAAQAMMEAMNKMSQLAFGQSAMATTKIVEQALAKQEEKYKSELPNHIKRSTVSESLRSENPALSHPAAQPILGAIESQMANKYPNATAAEITSMAKDYLVKFTAAVSPTKTEETTDKSNKGGTDFSDWDSF